MGERRGYVRPMGAWWNRNPFYGWYMLRELSCVFVTGYAIVLLVGLARLAQGRGPFEAWRASLAAPWSIGLHVVAFGFVLYHAWTWFKVMPKTLPFLRLAGARISDRAIVVGGVGAAAVCSLVLLVAVWVAGSR
jgi:succinate dehydrogenase subunit C